MAKPPKDLTDAIAQGPKPPRVIGDLQPISRHPIDMHPDPVQREYLRRAETYVAEVAKETIHPLARPLSREEWNKLDREKEPYLELRGNAESSMKVDLETDVVGGDPKTKVKISEVYSVRKILAGVDADQAREMESLASNYKDEDLKDPEIKKEYEAERLRIQKEHRRLVLRDEDGERTMYDVTALRALQSRMDQASGKDPGGPMEMVLVPSGDHALFVAVARRGTLTYLDDQGDLKEAHHNLSLITEQTMLSPRAIGAIVQHERGHLLEGDVERGKVADDASRRQEIRADRFSQGQGEDMQRGLAEILPGSMQFIVLRKAYLQGKDADPKDLEPHALTRRDMDLGANADHPATLDRIATLMRDEDNARVVAELNARLVMQMDRTLENQRAALSEKPKRQR